MQPLRVASSFCWNCVSAFMTARACVGTAIIIDFGKQVRIVCLHGRGMYRNWKQDRSCPSLAVLFGHLQRQIVLTEPLRIASCLTAGIATGKISLVQITATCFDLGRFLHDHLGTVIVGTCFSKRFHSFSVLSGRKSESPSCRFHSNRQRTHRPYARSYYQKRYFEDC